MGDGGAVPIECKWAAASFEPNAIAAFRRVYPAGETFVVAADLGDSYKRSYEGFETEFVSLDGLIEPPSERAGMGDVSGLATYQTVARGG